MGAQTVGTCCPAVLILASGRGASGCCFESWDALAAPFCYKADRASSLASLGRFLLVHGGFFFLCPMRWPGARVPRALLYLLCALCALSRQSLFQWPQ